MQEAANDASIDYEELKQEMSKNSDEHFHKPSILIVDDEIINIEVVSLALLSKKIPSQVAMSGQEAL